MKADTCRRDGMRKNEILKYDNGNMEQYSAILFLKVNIMSLYKNWESILRIEVWKRVFIDMPAFRDKLRFQVQ